MAKNLSLKMIVVLVSITAMSGLVLAGIWTVSVDKINANMQKVKLEAMRSMNPEMENTKIQKKAGQMVYEIYDSSGNLLSYVFMAQGNGFQAPIKMAVSVDPEWRFLLGIRVLEQSETPGLGAKVAESGFYNQFSKLSLAKSIVCSKESASLENSQIKAITSSTISSKAVVDIINLKISELRKAGF